MRAFLLFVLLLGASRAYADGWQPVLNAHSRLPGLFLAVDKGEQRTYFVRPENSTLEKEGLVCTTGRKDGDKQKEGDLKTPEGVYFIGDRIRQKLDYTLYGNTAFALNYPNPMDRLRGKTGYGIWIHGRGTPITPKLTRGCVALQNPRMDALHEHISIHQTPVLIAQALAWSNATDTPFMDVVRGTWSWISAKERRDPGFFDLYDAASYVKSSGAPFTDFVQSVQEESAGYPWLDIRVENMQILEGPGYVVSAFVERDLPYAGKAGHRRLYWVRENGRWKIAGEERVELGALDAADYARIVDKEIRALLSLAANLWAAGDRTALTEMYAPQCAIPALSATNPFSGEPAISLTERGVQVILSRPGAASNTVLFRPGPFDTWLVAAHED